MSITKKTLPSTVTLANQNGANAMATLVFDGQGTGIKVEALINGTGEATDGANEWVVVDTYTDPVTSLRMGGCTLRLTPQGGAGGYHLAK